MVRFYLDSAELSPLVCEGSLADRPIGTEMPAGLKITQIPGVFIKPVTEIVTEESVQKDSSVENAKQALAILGRVVRRRQWPGF
jgi:hypothetical protein